MLFAPPMQQQVDPASGLGLGHAEEGLDPLDDNMHVMILGFFDHPIDHAHEFTPFFVGIIHLSPVMSEERPTIEVQANLVN